ncbi:MAG: hypothetical protein KDA90_19265 [Planctomycetaceae bacterium]|nr:hypothetical protein [Planctomycetaceae bacterium]
MRWMHSLCALSALLNSAPTLTAQETSQTLQEKLLNAPPIVRVEEDWELLIACPVPEQNLPQIVTVFGPTDADFGTHTVFELNHGTLPEFGEGGMQLQVWWRDLEVGHKAQHAPTELSFENELVTYTTVTRLKEDLLYMEVIRGKSVSYGDFGNSGLLQMRLYTFRNDLNPYDPDNSIRNSRVTYGANRVNRFVRRAIRFYKQGNNGPELYCDDTTPTYVHRLATDTGE